VKILAPLFENIDPKDNQYGDNTKPEKNNSAHCSSMEKPAVTL